MKHIKTLITFCFLLSALTMVHARSVAPSERLEMSQSALTSVEDNSIEDIMSAIELLNVPGETLDAQKGPETPVAQDNLNPSPSIL